MDGDSGWKNSATDAILRLLYESEVAISPGGITVNLEYKLERPPSRSTVTRAIEGLRKNGHLEKLDPNKSYYYLTQEGREYAEENLYSD